MTVKENHRDGKLLTLFKGTFLIADIADLHKNLTGLCSGPPNNHLDVNSTLQTYSPCDFLSNGTRGTIAVGDIENLCF